MSNSLLQVRVDIREKVSPISPIIPSRVGHHHVDCGGGSGSGSGDRGGERKVVFVAVVVMSLAVMMQRLFKWQW